MSALTKAEMAEHLSAQTGLNRRDAKVLVEVFFEEINKALASGETVKLSGFGNFEIRQKNQRPGRNPKTGEEIPILARRVVTFRAGQKFRSKIETLQTATVVKAKKKAATKAKAPNHEAAQKPKVSKGKK